MYIHPNDYAISEYFTKLIIVFKNTRIESFIDTEDYERVKTFHWRVSQKKRKFYVCTGQAKNGGKIVYLHNLIYGFAPNGEQEVDHIDGDSLNNRKANLRLTDRIDNIHNVCAKSDNRTTGIRGVSFNKRDNDFMVDFAFNKTRLYFKHFNSLEEATYVRFLCETKLLGQYRSVANDELKQSLIARLNNTHRQALEEYVNTIMQRKGLVA